MRSSESDKNHYNKQGGKNETTKAFPVEAEILFLFIFTDLFLFSLWGNCIHLLFIFLTNSYELESTHVLS